MPPSNKDLISNTRRVTPEKDPRLYSLFRAAMKKLKPKCRIGIRVGKLDDYACAIPKTENNSYTVCVSEYALSVLDSPEILFVLGHEIGHVIMFLPSPFSASADKNTDPVFPDLAGCHPDIANMVRHVYGEMSADILGVSVVEDVNIAVSAYNKLMYGQFPNRSVERPDGSVGLAGSAEMSMQMKILRQLEKSEFFYDVIGKPLFGYGLNLDSEDLFFPTVKDLLKPWMQLSAAEHDALMECCHASLNILLREEGGGLKTISEYSYIWDNFSPEKISEYASIEEAYIKIQELSPVLTGMDHVLKFRLFGDVIVYGSFEIEKDPYVAEEFVRDIGRSFGFSANEMRQYLSPYQHRFEEMKKAS